MNTAEQPVAHSSFLAGITSTRWRSALLFAGIVVVGLALRLFRLDYADHWHDEVISTFAARAPALDTLTSITASDTHPPGYHILLHYWGAVFGYELIPLRLFSVVTSLLCLPAIYLLGRELLGHRVGMFAAALLAIAPFQIFHGQQARMYPLLLLVVLLATHACVAAWRRGGAWRWGLFGLVAALGLYTQVYFAFSLLALNLWALAESVRQRRLDRAAWAGLVGAQAVAVVLFGPFLLNMLALTSGVVSNFWIRSSTPLDWLFGLATLVSYWSRVTAELALWRQAAVVLPAIAVMLALIYGVAQARRSGPEASAWTLLVLAVLTPPLVGNALSLAVKPILIDRSLSGVMGPLFILLAAVAVRSWPHRATQVLAPAVVLSMAAGLLVIYPTAPLPHSLRPALDTVMAERRPGDAVVVLDWQSFDLVALRYPDAEQIYVGTGGPINTAAYWQRRMAYMRWPTPEPIGVAGPPATSYERVWVVQTPYTYPDVWATVTPWLASDHRLLNERAIGDTTLFLYEQKPSP